MEPALIVGVPPAESFHFSRSWEKSTMVRILGGVLCVSLLLAGLACDNRGKAVYPTKSATRSPGQKLIPAGGGGPETPKEAPKSETPPKKDAGDKNPPPKP
jgi:hypothetical protein